MEEANGLVRWPEEAPALGQREDELPGLPLVELPHKHSGAGADAEAAANQDGPLDGGDFRGEGGDQHVVPPRCGE